MTQECKVQATKLQGYKQQKVQADSCPQKQSVRGQLNCDRSACLLASLSRTIPVCPVP